MDAHISGKRYRRPYVLLVDDNPDQLFTFKTLLESSGKQVITANSALEAAEVLKDVHVDLVISDINMPVINGKEFVKRLRSAHTQAHLPIVTFSADTTLEPAELSAIGVTAHCDKGYPRQLVKTVDGILDNNSATTNLLTEIQTRFA